MKEDLVSTAKTMAEVWNDHDLEGALDFFSDDAVVELRPSGPDMQDVYSGKQEIRKWLEQIFGQDFHLANIRNIRTEGNTVTCDHDLHLNSLADLGVDPAYATIQATFENDKIKSLVGMLSDESAAKMKEAIEQRQAA